MTRISIVVPFAERGALYPREEALQSFVEGFEVLL